MTPTQFTYLQKILTGRKVDDIGCGPRRRLEPLESQIDYRGFDKDHHPEGQNIVADLGQPCPLLRHDVAFISWPINRRSIAWHLFLPEYQEIIYLGTNHSGTVCGDLELWNILQSREVLEVLTDPQETLIHYGKNPRPKNAKTPREEAWGAGVWIGENLATYSPEKYL